MTPRLRTALLAAALAVAGPAFAAPVPYEIDARHTQVLFVYSHFGLSNITGRFTDVGGTFAFDPADPAASRIEVTIPIASVSTGVPKLDAHMASADMFDAAQFPTATFKSTSVTAAGEGRWNVAGDLTLHGVTKPVTLAVKVNYAGPHPMSKAPVAGFDAATVIKRSDFGITYMLPGVPDEVHIRITMEAKGPKA
jgi:polyisoprenoid-binding protein YceI